jgi:hypothetical protein
MRLVLRMPREIIASLSQAHAKSFFTQWVTPGLARMVRCGESRDAALQDRRTLYKLKNSSF